MDQARTARLLFCPTTKKVNFWETAFSCGARCTSDHNSLFKTNSALEHPPPPLTPGLKSDFFGKTPKTRTAAKCTRVNADPTAHGALPTGFMGK